MNRLLRRLAALAACLLPLLAAAAPTTAPRVQVTTAPATLRTLAEDITVYGKVEPDPERLRALTTLRPGEITRLWVGLGQRVAAGQRLLEIATAPQARMAYTQAQGKVASARIQLQQNEDLFKQQLSTRGDLANARQALANAEAELKALERQGASRSSDVLSAPEAAVVTQLNVAPGAQVQAGQPLLMLGAQRHVWVRLGIEPEEVARVRNGMPVRLMPVFGGAAIDAHIAQVHAVVNPATHLVDAVVRLQGDAAGGMVPGSWMRGDIRLHSARTLAVLRSAVLTDRDGSYVFRVRDGRARRVAVTTGIEAGGWIAVRGALGAGDVIVTSGNYELNDGMPVQQYAGAGR